MTASTATATWISLGGTSLLHTAEAIAELGTHGKHVNVVTIAAADHFYTQGRSALADRIGAWLTV